MAIKTGSLTIHIKAMRYRRIPTTLEVYRAIKKNHPGLTPFSSISRPNGDEYGSSLCEMATEFGFPDADFPIIGISNKWERSHNPDKPLQRVNERWRYWLCVGVDSESG